MVSTPLMVVTCTCLAINMYHYRYQERTPNSFESENQLFGVQYTWWLVSIIQFTETLSYYCHYKIFPSDYGKNLVVMPLPKNEAPTPLIPESEIPVRSIETSGGESSLSQGSLPLKEWIGIQHELNTTRSGKVFKNKKTNHSNSEPRRQFGQQSKKELKNIRLLLRTADFEY